MAAAARNATRCAGASAIPAKALEAVLAAVEPTRLRIMFLIGERGRMCVGDIAGHFKISRPAISHHLKILRSYGLVETEREGREIYYAMCLSGIVDTLRTLADSMDACCQGAWRAKR